MITTTGTGARSIAGALALAFLVGPAAAGGLKDDPAPTGRMLEWSASFAVTNDYVFRGMSQSNKNPAVQAGLDLTYGILYAGVWASTIDFGETIAGRSIATSEVDIVAGIKPKLGPVSFDFGVIYYTYPGARDAGAELNYWEVKAGASVEPWKGGTIGVTGFYSPDYTGETGDVWTVEGSISQELPKVHNIALTFSALVGHQWGDDAAYFGAFGTDEYTYWNAGLTLGFHERFSLDLRYWDSDLDFCQSTRLFHCGARFVGTAKATF
ncbi:MAG: TorF family putative porin [Hyphomicrobiaceae bacterium]